MNCYDRHFPLNRDNSLADALELIAEFVAPRVVLLSNMSRAGGSSSEKAGSS